MELNSQVVHPLALVDRHIGLIAGSLKVFPVGRMSRGLKNELPLGFGSTLGLLEIPATALGGGGGRWLATVTRLMAATTAGCSH